MAGYGWVPPSKCTGTFHWSNCHGGTIPGDAVPAGRDKDGGPLFAGRAYHNGDLVPAKVAPSHGCAFISYGGDEITKHSFEVLISSHVAWKYARGGDVPPEAIRVGNTQGGEPLYLGRTMIDGTLTPGKVHPSHGCLYIPYGGKEMSFPEYEVMILC